MDLSTFIVAVLCLIDDRLKGRRIRQRGPAPKLSDAEVRTMEIVGEFLELDTDKAIFLFFRRHYGEWFPALDEVHRSTFARQAANLWKVKERLWQELLALAPHDPPSPSATRCPCRPACSPALTDASVFAEKRLSARTRYSPSDRQPTSATLQAPPQETRTSG